MPYIVNYIHVSDDPSGVLKINKTPFYKQTS